MCETLSHLFPLSVTNHSIFRNPFSFYNLLDLSLTSWIRIYPNWVEIDHLFCPWEVNGNITETLTGPKMFVFRWKILEIVSFFNFFFNLLRRTCHESCTLPSKIRYPLSVQRILRMTYKGFEQSKSYCTESKVNTFH